MKKRVGNLHYNTDTAAELVHSEGYREDPESYFIETLYRTRRGDYFIAGEGGTGSPWGGRPGIIVVTEDFVKRYYARTAAEGVDDPIRSIRENGEQKGGDE